MIIPCITNEENSPLDSIRLSGGKLTNLFFGKENGSIHQKCWNKVLRFL
jgi:hypothetical protein